MQLSSHLSHSSGVRVLTSCLLTWLLIVVPLTPLVPMSYAKSRVGTTVVETKPQTSNATTPVALNAPFPQPAPEPMAASIAATLTDNITSATTVAPGGTITYTATITNNGATSPADDATNVNFSDTIDTHTTLVNGSLIAVGSDSYTTIGNVQISVPDGSTDLLGNDFDPDTGNNAGMTVTGETKSSTACTGGCSNNVTINANGSFTYDTPVGFTGTDTFTYTAISGSASATTTVKITVANKIWFINNNAGACTSNCDGRLSHPFTSLASFNAANVGGAGKPDNNDWIFVFESPTDYTGPATLRLGQKFIGQDATASLITLTGFTQPSGTNPLPAMNATPATFVNISGTNVNGINLNSGNLLRGFTVGNVGTGTKISGTNFGTLTVGNSAVPDVTLNGTGQALSLSTGTLSVTGGFVTVATTSSAAQGINLSGVADSDGVGGSSFSFGSTTVSGSTTQGILVGTTTADLNFGATSVTGGTDGISLQNNSAGTRVFGTLGVSGGSGRAFLHSAGGGNVTVTGVATLSSVNSAVDVSSPGATTVINFLAATSATSTGVTNTAVNWAGTAGASLSFNSLTIQRNLGTALNAAGGGTINVTNNTGSINNTTSAASAIVGNGVALNLHFSAINSTGGVNAVSLTNVTGTSDLGAGSLTGTALGPTFLISGGSATVTYSGGLTQASNAAAVSITNHSTGVITFQTGTINASNGAGLVFDNADGTYNFNGTTTLNGGNAHVQITNGAAGTFSFSSNTSITNPSAAPAFDVSGGAASAPNVTYGGTITQNTATRAAINISGINGGTETFSGSIGSNGGTGVSIEGTGGTVNISGDITLNNTAAVFKACSGTCASPSGTGLHITATGTNNTIGATNAATTAAVTINGAQIDSSGVTFKSVAVNGATKGILVNNTGTAGGNGSFSITGTGTTVGSGGTIQNITQRGAELSTTKAPSLKNMAFTNANTTDAGGAGTCDDSSIAGCFAAIYLNGATAPLIDNVDITGTTHENGINGLNITGGFTFTNGTIANAGLNDGGADLPADEGAMVMRELTGTVTLDSNVFSFSSGPTVEIKNTTGNLLLNTNSTTYRDTQASASGQGGLQVVATGTTIVHPSVTVNVNSCTFLRLRSHGVNVQAIGTTDTGSASADVDITTSTFDPDTGTMIGIDLDADDASTLAFNIVNNTKIYAKNGPAVNIFGDVTAAINGRINNNGDVRVITNAGSNVGSGIRANINKSASAKIEVKSNVVNVGSDDAGIDLSGIGRTAANPGGATNTLDATVTGNNVTIGATSTYNLIILSATNAGDTNAICANVASNTMTRNPSSIASFRARVPSANGFFRMNGFNTNAETTWNANGNTPVSAGGSEVSFGGSGTFGGCTAALPSNPTITPSSMPTTSASVAQPAQRSDSIAETTSSSMNTAVAVNATASQMSLLSRTANLFTNFANAVAGVIEPTVYAAELDPSATDDVSQISKQDVQANHARASLHNRAITTAKADTSGKAAPTTPRVAVPFSGETVSVNLGTLAAGASVTVSYQVTVNNPPNLSLLNPPRVSTQATVTANGGAINVQTDDPEPGGGSDPTVTQIDLYGTTTSVITSGSPSNQNDAVTFTATVAANNLPFAPPGGTIPQGTVQFFDGATPITCNEGSTSIQTLNGSSQATCTTSALSSAGSPHTINANYAGDGNFDPSSGSVQQSVIACASNPVVTSTADSGANTLRDALANICNGTTITFDLAGAGPHTITLTTGELAITKNVTINNNSGESITISGNNASRVLNVNSGKTASIIGLTMSGGSATNGAGIINDGTLTVVNSTLTGNTATSDGGGIHQTATATSLTLINTTVSGNNANGFGGGVDVLGGTATISNSTVSNNHGDNDNGGGGGAGGLRNQGGTVTLKNTIIAGNFAGSATSVRNDIEGTIDAASSNNLVGDGTNMTGISNGVNGNQVGSSGSPIDPQIGPLANNGGTTSTHALLATSPAIEAGSNANLPTDTFDLDSDANTAETLPVDQRGPGFPRTADSADANTIQTVDIGAFELHPSIEDIANQSTNEDTVKNVTFNLGDDTGSLIALVAATSSNTTLVPNANLSFSGSGGSRTLQITPAANLSGTTTITVTVTATNGRTATDTFDLTVNAANDPPSGTDNTVTTAEETAYTFAVVDFGFSDPNDSPPNTLLAVKITTLPGLGTLTNNNVPVNAGDFIPVANITGGLLKFTPAVNGTGSPYTSFTFQVQDNGGGTDLDPTPNTMSVNVTGVNDAPVNTVPGPQNTNEDTVLVFSSGSANQISVADVDAGANPVKITLTATNGTLTLTTTAGLSFITGDGTSDATMMFTGTLTAINTALNGMSFNPTANFNGSASLTITSDDQGNSGTGGPLTDTDTVNITVNAQNDAPVVTTTAGNLAYTENAPATAIDPGLTVTDNDSTNLAGATVAITAGFVSGQDTLAFSNTPNIIGIYNSGTGVLTLTGTDTVANYQAALRSVTYQNSSDNPTASRTVTFTVDDGTSTASASRGIAITAVNDAPVNTVPGAQGTGLNTPLVFSSGTGNQISIADVDAGTNTIQVTLTATNGTLTLSGTSGLAFTVGDGTADATMTFTGTITNINAALNGLTFTPTAGFSGAATITITTNDQGNTGSGGPLTDTDTVSIQVANNIAIQDAQVVEPSTGSVNMIFTVALSAPAPAGGVAVSFTTQDQAPALNHATAGQDYTTTSGTVTFAPGEQFKTILVPVLSDNQLAESNETFLVVLSNPVNGTIVDDTATGTILITNQPGALLIRELRTSGPGGAGDDFVEIYNNSDSPVTVSDPVGYGLFKMGADCSAAPILIGVIPNGTVIPARGHYLFVGSAYSLANYGGSNAAAGDQTLMSDIESDRNVALFSTTSIQNLSTVTRLDAVGYGPNVGATCDLLREGNTLTPTVGSVLEHSYVRDECGKKGNPAQMGVCLGSVAPRDTNSNSDDFIFVDTTGAITPAGQRLGAPGPQNLGSPVTRSSIAALLLDSNIGTAAAPNRVRDFAPVTNGANGTMSIRRRFVNNTGGSVTRLRFRVVDISAIANTVGVADIRALTASNVTVNGITDTGTCATTGTPNTAPCSVTVFGTTLETPPAQPLGGGLNSSLSAGTITLATPLPAGASINLQFLLGVQQTGSFKFYINIEGLSTGGALLVQPAPDVPASVPNKQKGSVKVP